MQHAVMPHRLRCLQLEHLGHLLAQLRKRKYQSRALDCHTSKRGRGVRLGAQSERCVQLSALSGRLRPE